MALGTGEAGRPTAPWNKKEIIYVRPKIRLCLGEEEKAS